MNGVVERRNKTLKNMVRSMIAHSTLPESLWGEAQKTTAYILNTDVEFRGRNKARDIAFDEELNSNSVATIIPDNVQASTPFIDQEMNLEPQQDNVDEAIVHEEQIQRPQEQEPLMRAMREKRNAISDDYFVFL
ncbi:uncharacterized protein LOC133039219 [Cannabis sativa]|uniref:uncharacterized protein LOC133039219 n=1 Tax=Cannabis sativa TaxID=3483 RepID=UPI0029CAA332|nr:uncharacterized protein LOC133039219 [Cannabis sativa]